MKRIIITTLCALACLASAIAQIGYRQDDITYSLNTDKSGNNYAVVIGNVLNESTAIDIPESISYENNIYKVTEIGDNAFKSCTYLTGITLPNTIVSIGDYAFYGCRSISNIILPESLKTLGEHAFYGCGIINLNIPGGIEKIPNDAFAGCKSMKEVTISEGVKTIDEYAFSGSTLRKITIHAFLDYIEYRAFYQCKLLEEFTVKGGVKKIGSSVFVEDTYLTRVTLPNDLVSIGDYAFYICTYLPSIDLPSSLVSIGSRAFCWTEVGNVFIPENVTSIGESAFYSTRGKRERVAAPIRLKSGYTNWIGDSGKFCWYDNDAIVYENRIVYSKDYTKLFFVPDSYTESLVIPSTVTEIGYYALYKCNTKSITLPSSVTTIGQGAFQNASGISTVDLPNIIHIGNFAFMSTSLNSLHLGEQIDSIGTQAFYGSNLMDYIIPLKVPKMGKQVFSTLKKYGRPKGMDCSTIITSSSVAPISYNEKDIVENGMIFDSSKSAIRYASCGVIPEEYTVPSSITRIGTTAFYYCTDLTTLVISEGVKSINEQAFAYCSSLKTIHLPGSLTSISSEAFTNSSDSPIEKIYYNTTKPVKGDKNIFTQKSYDNTTLYVPKGSSDNFLLVSPWMYFHNIQEIDFAGIDGVKSDEYSDASVEYYNLQGIRVENPESGLYIRRQGNKSTKVYIP